MEGLRLLLTGASRGLGRALALCFAERGVRLVLTARTEGGLAEVAEEIVSKGFPRPVVAVMDLRATAEAMAAAGEGMTTEKLGGMIVEELGGLEGVVLNAGVLGELSPVVHSDDKMWRDVFEVNVFSNRRLLEGLHGLLCISRGFVVGVTCGEHRGGAYWGCYGASKAAMEVMLGSYGGEVRRLGIGVEVWDPGRMSTGLRCLAYPGEDSGEGFGEGFGESFSEGKYPITEETLGGCVEIVERWMRGRKWAEGARKDGG